MYAWIIDESTDVVKSKQLLLYVVYFVGHVFVETKLFEIIEISGGDSNTVHVALKKALTDKGVDTSKCAVAGGSDGASVMTGEKAGVSKRWEKSENPFSLLYIVSPTASPWAHWMHI